MPEVNNHYIGAEILLPRGNKMVKGLVVARSLDASGKYGQSPYEPILDNGMCQVEFAGGVVKELTADVIAESMSTQCAADRKYLLLDVLVDYHKDNHAITLTDQ